MEVCIVSLGPKSRRLHSRLNLHFDSNREFVIGRNRDAQLMILDVNVSRKHCSINYSQNSGFTIQDNKSTNGVFVNGRKIHPEKPHNLKHLDKFTLSADKTYEWRFEVLSNMKPDLDAIIKMEISKAEEKIEAEKKDLEAKVAKEKAEQEKLRLEKEQLMLEMAKKREEFEAAQKLEYIEFEKKLFATKELADKQRVEFEQKLQEEMKVFNEKNAETESVMGEKIRESEAKMAELLHERAASLEAFKKEKEKMEMAMQEEKRKYEEQIKDMTESKEKIQQEFAEKIQQAQLCYERAVELEKNEREEERQKMIEELHAKEQKISQLKDLIKDKHEGDENALKQGRLKLLKSCNEELKCTVCDELFVTPMTLNCGHVFCQFCIKEWEFKCDTKAKFTCPNCRELVTTQVRSLHIENLISALFRDVDVSLIEDRKTLVQERQAEIEKAAANKKKAKKPSKKATRNIREWAQRSEEPRTSNEITHYSITDDSDGTTSSSSSSDDDSNTSSSSPDDDSDASVEGVDGSYYGGYGSCYNCGRRGHWAPGCPELQ